MTDPDLTRPDLPRLNLAGQDRARAAPPAAALASTRATVSGPEPADRTVLARTVSAGTGFARTGAGRPASQRHALADPRLAAWRALHASLSARAVVVGMFAVFLLSDLTAGSLHVAALTGFGFAAGSAAAAGCTRRQELLVVTTTPPAIFLAAVTCSELVTMQAGHVRLSAGLVGADVFLTLSAAAPWLFGGLAGALVIATVRGLPQCVRDLRADLLGTIVRH